MANPADREVPVLIVGGSLVGLSAAMLLGSHGIPALAVEHHRGTAIHPRAAQISQRTMEIFRTVGIEQIVRRKSGEQFVQDGAIVAVETLAGKEIAQYISNLNQGIREVSPSERVFISQSLLEPLLKKKAEDFGAELRFGTDMLSFEQDESGVTAVVRERDREETATIRARYMIAADGAHSRIREQLGIRMAGHGVFSHSATIYFRANVAPLLRGRNLSVIYVLNPVLRGFFRFEKPFDSGFLAINATGDPADPNTDVSAGLTAERCLELIYAALGTRDVPVKIESVMHWDAEANAAERLQQGRVFLAGDAAHAMPPNGGFGGNTGVQDAHNLAWKLALALTGVAGPEILATYDAERRPVGIFTMEQAYSRYVTRTAPYLGAKGMQPVEKDLDVEMGYRYSSAAVAPDGGGGSGGRPGARAPHVPVESDGAVVSTLDLLGKGFTVLAASEGKVWEEAARRASQELKANVEHRRIMNPHFAEAYGISAAGAALVRPDGFIAWRSVASGGDPVRDLTRALAQVLCREPASVEASSTSRCQGSVKS
ncbi:MAG TPA: FAD-dependent monooxygenase [Bryobacteraceae bacterium]|nr:FAD-dependent monooxygenase [Bryobacteraceae bacterium]